MTEFYKRAAATALRLLTSRGQQITLTASRPGSYSTSTGKPGAPSTTTTTVRGVVVSYEAKQIDGSLIRAKDRKVIIAVTDTSGAAVTAPVENDRITLANGEIMTVVSTEIISPAGIPVVFFAQARK